MMKTSLLAAIAFIAAEAVLAPPTHAASNGAGAQPAQSLYTCAAGGLSRVALATDPAACCNGSISCPQLLSNTGLVKSKRVNRT